MSETFTQEAHIASYSIRYFIQKNYSIKKFFMLSPLLSSVAFCSLAFSTSVVYERVQGNEVAKSIHVLLFALSFPYAFLYNYSKDRTEQLKMFRIPNTAFVKGHRVYWVALGSFHIHSGRKIRPHRQISPLVQESKMNFHCI